MISEVTGHNPFAEAPHPALGPSRRKEGWTAHAQTAGHPTDRNSHTGGALATRMET